MHALHVPSTHPPGSSRTGRGRPGRARCGRGPGPELALLLAFVLAAAECGGWLRLVLAVSAAVAGAVAVAVGAVDLLESP